MGEARTPFREAEGQEDERMKDGLTFDTGALIALERRSARARRIVERAAELKVRVTVPAPVLTEWWRGRSDVRDHIVGALRVEPLTEYVAKLAGEALAAVRTATPIDAIVMASATQRGDIVYTSDVGDLQSLASYFRSVRVLAIG